MSFILWLCDSFCKQCLSLQMKKHMQKFWSLVSFSLSGQRFPLFTAVYQICFEGKPVQEMITCLQSHPEHMWVAPEASLISIHRWRPLTTSAICTSTCGWRTSSVCQNPQNSMDTNTWPLTPNFLVGLHSCHADIFSMWIIWYWRCERGLIGPPVVTQFWDRCFVCHIKAWVITYS